MIPASDELKKVLKTNHAIKISAGCLIEYNLNSMVNDIVITGAEITTATGYANRTFLVINDATEALAETDTWIDITGVAGTFAIGDIIFG